MPHAAHGKRSASPESRAEASSAPGAHDSGGAVEADDHENMSDEEGEKCGACGSGRSKACPGPITCKNRFLGQNNMKSTWSLAFFNGDVAFRGGWRIIPG